MAKKIETKRAKQVKVRLLCARSGPAVNQVAGDVVSVSEREAEALIKTQQAEPIDNK